LNRILLAAIALLWAFLAGLSPSLAAAEGERFTSWVSDITIGRDGTLDITERIGVVSEGRAIQHGIFRDFPTTYFDAAGNRYRVGFEVESVTRDGRGEPYIVENITNGKRIRIGSEVALLPPGQHIYTIHYRTDRQIGFFPEHDELYWNVIGYPDFPVSAAEAVVHAPSAITRYDFFTGPPGVAGKNAVATRLSADSVRIRSAPLGTGESLIIAVAFEKGAIVPPGALQRTLDFLSDNATILAALGGLLALSFYYLVAWLYFGRDPARGIIVPLFAPPKGFSAAATRFVHRMGYDRKAFSAALIEMAVKGYLTIAEEGDDYTLKRTGRSEEEAHLTSAERAVARELFSNGTEIELKQVNHRPIGRAVGALQQALRREDEGVYFVTNRVWFFIGIAVLAASAGAVALLSDVPETTAAILAWLSLWSAATSFLLYRMAESWQGVLTAGGARIRHLGSAIGSTAGTIFFLLPLIIGVAYLSEFLPFAALGALVVQGALAAVFYQLLKAPTAAGAKIRDQIDGFQMFLVTTERERLEVLHPPDVTPELFEKYLPYAIALDAENEWSRKFEIEAARAGMSPEQAHRPPHWYSGSHFGRHGHSAFASSLGTSLAAATAASATPPGKGSGGFGGGGRVGGGFGGGGRVGGW
jgi:hypothetical protein